MPSFLGLQCALAWFMFAWMQNQKFSDVAFGEFLDFLFLKRKEKKQHVQRYNSLSKDNIRFLLLYYTFSILFFSFSGHGLGYS